MPWCPVTFNEIVTTEYGQTIKIVGNNNALGNWNPNNARALSADQYTSDNPVWRGTVNLFAGEVIQYKYIVVESNGVVTWENDPDHMYVVAADCKTTATVVDRWQLPTGA